MKIAYFDHTGGKHRIDSLAEALKLQRQSSVMELCESISAGYEEAPDLLFVEHLAHDNAVIASKNSHLFKKIILRLNAMEIYKWDIKKIHWEGIDGLFVHGIHLKEYIAERWGVLPPEKIHIVPIAFDTDKFPLRKNPEKNLRVAIVSEMHWRKGCQDIPRVMEQMLRENRHYRFYHIGKITDHDCKNYLDYKLKEMGISEFYNYQGQRDPSEVNEWLEDKSIIVHPSYTEGMPRAVGEAMSKGLYPIIRRYRGANKQWPTPHIYDNFDQVRLILRNAKYDPVKFRKYIVDNYSKEVIAQKANKIFEDVCA